MTTWDPVPSRLSCSRTLSAQPASCSTAATRKPPSGGPLVQETSQEHRADSAAELDDAAAPVDDNVVADGHEPSRAHGA
jgi:hypothetical protein